MYTYINMYIHDVLVFEIVDFSDLCNSLFHPSLLFLGIYICPFSEREQPLQLWHVMAIYYTFTGHKSDDTFYKYNKWDIYSTDL